MKIFAVRTILVLALVAIVSPRTVAQSAAPDSDHEFRLSSTTFTDGGQLPLSSVLGSNFCTFVSGGGDQSPELSWSNAPRGTQSFVVTLFDVTASFTHWGLYNISRKTTELPENAGVAGSIFGLQVFNDFFLGAEYDGPCPPSTVTPIVHDYVFTVYALDSKLQLTSFPPNFPADAETLYRAMFDHVLKKASVHGFFSTAN
jgi:Raf kinase inhibitor-like YbhB/YbcL family protein